MGVRSVSVIVVNYNGRAFLPRLFRSLDDQTLPPHEVVLVDNASTDGSVEMVRRDFENVRVIATGSNAGFAVANNIGVEQTSGIYIALLNSDAFAHPRWLESLVSALEKNDRAAAAVGKIYMSGIPGVFDQAGGMFNNVGNYWGRGHLERDDGQYDVDAEVPGVTACAMLLRRDALAGGDLFDSDFFMYGEELDLTLRLRSEGWRIVYTPAAIAYHDGMGSLSARADARLFQQHHANANRLKVLARRFPRPLLLRSAIPLLLGFCYWNAFFLFRGGPRFALHAIRTQLAMIRRGLAARTRRDRESAARWTPWMLRQSTREMLALKRQTHRY